MQVKEIIMGGGSVGTIVIIIAVFIGIFFLCRELICWYYKINRLVALTEEQKQLLKKFLIHF